jgi:hypothetical protein
VTFTTITQLPNIPGAVNDCAYLSLSGIFCRLIFITPFYSVLAGRTYPLEGKYSDYFQVLLHIKSTSLGSAVPLPQSAPYTDPLEILICGGSTIGAGFALDNCVTIAPEAPNAKWTLERMVSRTSSSLPSF